MKKKRIFAIALSLAMVLTTVFAGAESVFAGTSDIASAKTSVMTATAIDDNTVTAVNMNGTETPVPYTATGYSKGKDVYVKIEMPKAGTLQFAVRADSYDTVVGLFNTIDGTQGPLSTCAIPKKTAEDDFYIYSQNVKEAGTYYLVFSTNSYSPAQSTFGAGYIAGTATNSNTTVSSGKTRYASVSGSGFRYYKITTAGARYLKISFPDSSDNTAKFKVKLYNSSKKKTNLLKGNVTIDSGKDFVTYVGVPKGTYYIGVSTDEDWYAINIKSTKVSENSGSKKSTAKGILKGSTKKGIITATQSSTSGDWYKFTINSSQLVKFQIDTLTGGYSGGIRVEFYNKNQTRPFGSADYYYGTPGDVVSPYTMGSSKLAPGTYYIKVKKYGSGSGYYKLKWL